MQFSIKTQVSYAAEKTVLVCYFSLKGEFFSLLISGLQSFCMDSLSKKCTSLELKQVKLCPLTGKQLFMGWQRICGSLLMMVQEPHFGEATRVGAGIVSLEWAQCWRRAYELSLFSFFPLRIS